MAVTTAPDRSGHTAHHGRPIMIAVLVAVLAMVATAIALLVYGSSGAAVTQTRTVAGFTSLDLAGSNNVTIIVGRPRPGGSVRIRLGHFLAGGPPAHETGRTQHP